MSLHAALSRLNIPMTWAAALAAAVQLAAWALWRRRLSRDRPAPRLAPAPSVAVVVPCKGDIPLANVETLLRQDYPGPLEILYVAPSVSDPAFLRLSAFFESRRERRARVLSSSAVPAACGEAMLNCIHGARKASPSSEVLMFIDSDLAVRPDWARRLAAGLLEPGVGVATTMMVVSPSAAGPWAFLRLVWIGLLAPFFSLRPGVSGHSYALRRRDFEAWGVARVWARCLTTDSSLAALARSRRARIRCVPLAAPVGGGRCGREAFFRTFDKWTVYLRLYAARDWLLAWLFALLKGWFYLRALRLAAAAKPGSLLILLGGDVLYGLLVFSSLRAVLRHRMRDLRWGRILAAGLAVPIVQAVYLWNLLRSLLLRDIVWGGYTYRVRSAYEIEVVR